MIQDIFAIIAIWVGLYKSDVIALIPNTCCLVITCNVPKMRIQV